MDLRLHALLFSTALLAMASAQGINEAVFEMDATGNARMIFREALDWEAQELNVMVSANAKSNVVSFSGTITDTALALNPDYKADINVKGDVADLTFEASGAEIARLLEILGDFNLDITVEESSGALKLDASALIQRSVVQDLLLIDVDSIQADPAVAESEFEAQLNELFSQMPLDMRPRISIDELGITGSDTLSITLKMTIEGWSDFIASVIAMSYQQDNEDRDFLTCLGLSVEELVSATLGSSSRSTMSVSGSGDRISGSVNTVLLDDKTASWPSLESMDAELSKTGMTMTLQGSVIVKDVQTLMTCVVRSYMPGDYTIENLDYTLVRGKDGMAMQSLSGRIIDLGKKSGGEYQLSFPEEMTLDFDVIVNVPAGMEIKSVSGGNITSSRSAMSEIGEIFTVTYGRAEPGPVVGLDTNMVIVVGIVLFLLILLLVTRRRSRTG